MRAVKDLDRPSFGRDAHEREENEYYRTQERFERVAEEIGVEPEHYDELGQMIEQELEGPSIGD